MVQPRLVSAREMTMVWLAVSIGGLAGCTWFDEREPVAGQPSFYRSLAEAGSEVDAQAAQSMISGYRQNNGLQPVVIDAVLMKVAAEQARGMAARDKLDHSVSRSFNDRIKDSGYRARLAAENVGAGYHTLAEAFSGWRDSPPHRANMLLKDATQMGIAAAYAPGSKYKVFWSLILAAPVDRRG
jgi:uncharacterized protein YkwD